MNIGKLIVAGILLIPGLVFGQGTIPTSEAVVSSLNPSMFGDAVTFTATLSITNSATAIITPKGASAPTGTVQFRDGAVNLGAPVPLTGLTAALTTSVLAVGSHPITARYSGDASYAASTSPVLIQVVTAPPPIATSVALVSSLNPSLVGQAVTFMATVTGNGPTGTIQFKDGAANLGAPVAMSGGAAALTTSALTLGTHPITAVYSGDSANLASTSPILNQVVNAPPTGTIALVSSLNPSLVGQAVTFTATVTGNTPTGTVQFKDGATNLGAPVALTGGSAALTTSALSIGTHPITATYSGDANNAGVTSSILNQVVNAPAPVTSTTSLSSSANPSAAGQAVTFTATVTGSNPTGTVQFKDGTTVIGAVATPSESIAAHAGPKAALVGGTATLTTSALAPGSHSITAVYSGDANQGAARDQELLADLHDLN